MRTWKLHFCWTLIAVASAGAWERWSVSDRESALRAREAAVGVSPAAPAEVASSPPRAPVDPAGSAEVLGPRQLPSGFQLLPDPNDVSISELRVLIKSTGFRELYRA